MGEIWNVDGEVIQGLQPRMSVEIGVPVLDASNCAATYICLNNLPAMSNFALSTEFPMYAFIGMHWLALPLQIHV